MNPRTGRIHRDEPTTQPLDDPRHHRVVSALERTLKHARTLEEELRIVLTLTSSDSVRASEIIKRLQMLRDAAEYSA